jgi:hypothetical protein
MPLDKGVIPDTAPFVYLPKNPPQFTLIGGISSRFGQRQSALRCDCTNMSLKRSIAGIALHHGLRDCLARAALTLHPCKRDTYDRNEDLDRAYLIFSNL